MKVAFLSILAFQAVGSPSVPFTVEKSLLQPTVVLSATVEPKRSATVKIRWYSLLKNITMKINQEVTSGSLLAEVSLEYLDYRRKYFEGRMGFVKRALEDAVDEEKLIQKERIKLMGLSRRGIIPGSQAEASEVKVVDAALKRMRTERDVRELKRQLDETVGQIKEANYYAPISGVITEMLVNPEQISGVVIAMPDSKLCRIDQPGHYVAKAAALDTQVVHLVPGMKGTVIFEASGEVLPATVASISLNTASLKGDVRFFDVVLEFDRPGSILPRGYQVRLEVPYGQVDAVATIPWTALKATDRGYGVLQYTKDVGWAERSVEVGKRAQHRVEILSGVKAGDIVDAQLW